MRYSNRFLPKQFPPFPQYKQFDLYATMSAAKAVGGDFYDFFLVDDNHLGFTIADVSDKGDSRRYFHGDQPYGDPCYGA